MITEDVFGLSMMVIRRVLMSRRVLLHKWALPRFIRNTLKLFALCELIIFILG
jgi:hypothetical protein